MLIYGVIRCIIIISGYTLTEAPLEPRIGLVMEGAFEDQNENSTTNFLYIEVELIYYNSIIDDDDNATETIQKGAIISDMLVVPLIDNVKNIDTDDERKRSHVFKISEKSFEAIRDKDAKAILKLRTNIEESLPIQLAYDPSPIDKVTGVMYASVVLLGLYIMIIWEIVHRTFAAMIASTLSIAILAYMNERPTMPELMSWIDVETLLLLFGMMILVAILSETGIFDYLAVYAYKV